MALVDDLREVRITGFPLRSPFLVITTLFWVSTVWLFATASWFDAMRVQSAAPYHAYLLGWTRGMLPWLFLFPIVFKIGARHSNSDFVETAKSAAIACFLGMGGVVVYAAFAFSIGTELTPLQTLSSLGVRAFLWDMVFFILAFLFGRQMRPAIDPRQFHAPDLGTLAVKSSGSVEYVPVREILGATAQGNYIALHLVDRDVLHRTTMANLEDALSTAGFVRIHRSHLVNPARISVARSRGESFRIVELTNGIQLPVSDRYRSEVREQLDQRALA
ncbi:LytTR family DNA-binding domain-containing protein [Maricaulis sp.]|uniref:LytR/AlgR family response regulator transcription factor n=1 Tax=Maricaulis sp. TaxID=1486257 RepID=UPI0025F85DC4|nr:LytTR family DNA-binding domain-containing protein [Maricaulis sp.]MDF1767683.1 LytTR family DNA-binding domain-containing protein [Maricaulis sp.]